jgi:hypothetical protein
MDTCPQSPGSNGDQGTISELDFHDRLDKLAGRWNSSREKDLQLRYRTGALLNKRFGSPENRQSRNAEVLKQAADRLQLAVSEVCRMRHFAFHFQSFQDFKAKHPQATTWTAVKELLPKVKPHGGQHKGQPPASAAQTTKRRKPKAPKLGVLKQALRSLSTQVRHAPTGLTDAQKKDLVERFMALAKAVTDCLQIKVSVGQVPAEETSSAAPMEQSSGGNSAA